MINLNDDINLFLGVFSYPLANSKFVFKDKLKEYYNGNLKSSNANTGKLKDLRHDLQVYISDKYYNIYSSDRLYLYLNKWYLYDREKKNKCKESSFLDVLFKNLEDITEVFISQRDGKIVYKYWENKKEDDIIGGFSRANKIYIYHGLNRVITTDILAIIYMIKNCKKINELNGFYGNIEISDSLLDKLFEKGMAENHMHMGASVSFYTNWDFAMKPLTYNFRKYILKNFENKNDEIYIKDKEAYLYLLLANIFRKVLFIYVLEFENKEENGICKLIDEDDDFKKFLENIIDFVKNIFPKYQNSGFVSGADFQNAVDDIFKINNVIENIFEELEIRNILKKYDENIKKIHTSDENLFLYKTVGYVYRQLYKIKKYRDPNFEVIGTLFLNYLRLKNHFFQYISQEKTIHGLNYFQAYNYDINGAFNNAVFEINGKDEILGYEITLREQFQNSNLKKVEFRTGTGKNIVDLKKRIIYFLKAYLKILHEDYCDCKLINGRKEYFPKKEFPRVGMVFHFIKREDFSKKDFCNLEENIQYKKLYMSYKNQINILNELRNRSEDEKIKAVYDKYILGIDVASLENEVPTWVFANIFENARDSKNEPIALDIGSNDKFQSLKFTFHAGEDFRHILSGLRRIHEIVKYLKFHAGDRIGHGIAVGIDINSWYEKNSTIIIPRIEALENYLWAFDILSRYGDSNKVNMSFLELKIEKLVKEIYGEDFNVPITMLVSSYKKLFDYEFFDNLAKKNKDLKESYCKKIYEKKEDNEKYRQVFHIEEINTVENIVLSKNCEEFSKKMNEPVHMKIEIQEIDIMTQIQKIIKAYLNKKGIVIETNPSSNVIIADIDNLQNHNIYNIYDYTRPNENMLVCVNTDDPAVFNTNIANELGYVYFTMVERNKNRDSTLSWVDKLRENSLNLSFINTKESDKEILEDLEYFIENV